MPLNTREFKQLATAIIKLHSLTVNARMMVGMDDVITLLNLYGDGTVSADKNNNGYLLVEINNDTK